MCVCRVLSNYFEWLFYCWIAGIVMMMMMVVVVVVVVVWMVAMMVVDDVPNTVILLGYDFVVRAVLLTHHSLYAPYTTPHPLHCHLSDPHQPDVFFQRHVQHFAACLVHRSYNICVAHTKQFSIGYDADAFDTWPLIEWAIN